MPRERRLVFGEVAELYDRYRPAYPERLADDLVRLADLTGAQTVLEVGAGTGNATAMLAARGFPVLAIEPSEAMVAVARRNFAAYPQVQIEQSDFENWDPAGRRFPLVFSAQAWHWVNPDVGYTRYVRCYLVEGCWRSCRSWPARLTASWTEAHGDAHVGSVPPARPARSHFPQRHAAAGPSTQPSAQATTVNVRGAPRPLIKRLIRASRRREIQMQFAGVDAPRRPHAETAYAAADAAGSA